MGWEDERAEGKKTALRKKTGTFFLLPATVRVQFLPHVFLMGKK
jgi:hypothetical protein